MSSCSIGSVRKEKPFRVLAGDFVTTEDGTGVVHTAPTFGADDYRVAMANDISAITLLIRTETFSPWWTGRVAFSGKGSGPDFVQKE